MVGSDDYFALSLSVGLTTAPCDVQSLFILSRRLRTQSLPTTYASVGYSLRKRRFISFKSYKIMNLPLLGRVMQHDTGFGV